MATYAALAPQPLKATLPANLALPERQRVAFAAPMSRPSWAPTPSFANPFLRVPQTQNLRLYEDLVGTIPVLGAALARIVQLAGCPKVVSKNKTRVADLNTWWENLPVNRIDTGGENWFSGWVYAALLYGRSHAEVILRADGSDIYALQQLHTRTIELRPLPDGYGLDLVQFQPFSPVPTPLNRDLILTTVHEPRNDSPQGNSLIGGLEFVGEIYEKLLFSVKETWTRYGVPVYQVRYKPPETLSDPTGTKTGAIAADMAASLDSALQCRADGQVKNFVTVGDVEVTVIGANGETLDIEIPGRQIMEQVLAKTGLPPMLLGFSWATSERMSRDQSILLGEMIDAVREHLEAPIRYLFGLRQAMVGRSFDFELQWEAPSLTDLQVEAQASLLQAQADAAALKVLEREWQLGIRSNIEVARARRPELAEATDARVLSLLPDLLAQPPVPPPSPFGGGGGNPPAPNTPTGGANPDVTRSLPYEGWKVTNGNGSH